MAVVAVTGNPVAGTKYTVTTASSADWASVSNSTYFFDLTDKLVHYKDSTGAIIELFGSGAGGLTYFTEAQSTASPNNLVNVDSLTAVTGTTNGDFAILPKGNGAILANIPDNAVSGGNKRGQYAVDFQVSRFDVLQVASGNYSVIIGGQSNKATNTHTVVGGYSNTASATYSVSFGAGNQSLGSASFSGGSSSKASNPNDFAYGDTCSINAGGYYGNICMGYQNTINTGLASTVFGNGNIVSNFNQFAAGNNHRLTSTNGSASLGGSTMDNAFPRFMYGSDGWVRGDSQSSKCVLNGRTTGATPLVLTIGRIGETANGQITLQNNNVFRVKGSITGKQSASTNVGVWDIDCVIVRGANAASTVIAGSANVNLVVNTGTFGTPTLTANTTLGCLTVTVIGVAATNIQWTCVIDTCEVIYA